MRYLIEFSTTKVTPVIVNADSQQEAIETALKQEGEVGDIYYREVELSTVKRLDK